MSVLCLIANPARPVLTPRIVETVQEKTGGTINWLHREIACEIIDPSAQSPETVARQVLNDLPVDAARVPARNRRKRLLLADMDSTMIEQECIDEMAAALDLKPRIAAITARAMAGELDFAQALAERVSLLAGLDLNTIKSLRRQAITLAPGGRVLVKTMREHGAKTVLVSGGFTIFADYFARRIGFDQAIANRLEFDENETLTGRVTGPLVTAQTKLDQLHRQAEQLGIPLSATLAVGDGANDLPMILKAGLGVAMHAKPKVEEKAPVAIRHADLSALLYLQGYGEGDLVY